MRKFAVATAAVAALVVVLGSPSAGGKTGGPSNIAPDADFESDPSGSYYTAGSAVFSWATDAAHSPSHSLKIVSTQPAGTLTRWMSRTTSIPATAGTTYTFSAYLKTSFGVNSANLSLDFWNAAGTWLGVTADSARLVSTHEWTYVFVTAKAPAKSAFVRMEFRLFGPGTVWADDASLTTDTPSPSVPTLGGTPRQGQFLTTTLGSWPAGATLFQIYWQRCDVTGLSCQTHLDRFDFDYVDFLSTYLLSADDVGFRIRSEVQMVVGGSLAIAHSTPSPVVTGTSGLPENTELPEITGPAGPDNTLSVSTGSWTGSPTEYSYQWYACADDASSCSPITGETGSTLDLAWDSPTQALRAAVFATNAAGSSRAASIRYLFRAKVVVYALPTIQGNASVGSTLTASNPRWTGIPTYLSAGTTWYRCDPTGAVCSMITGGRSYTLTGADTGHTIRAIVTIEISTVNETLDETFRWIGAASAPTAVVTG